jgi:hypothetical protein
MFPTLLVTPLTRVRERGSTLRVQFRLSQEWDRLDRADAAAAAASSAAKA